MKLVSNLIIIQMVLSLSNLEDRYLSFSSLFHWMKLLQLIYKSTTEPRVPQIANENSNVACLLQKIRMCKASKIELSIIGGRDIICGRPDIIVRPSSKQFCNTKKVTFSCTLNLNLTMDNLFTLLSEYLC